VESIDSSEKSVFDEENSQDADLKRAIAESLQIEQISLKQEAALFQPYHLQCVVSHRGERASGGHYVTDAYDALTGEWKNYNDESVRTVSEDQALRDQSSSYLCFYVHHTCWPK